MISDTLRIGKPHSVVRVGDILTLMGDEDTRVIRIVALPIRRGPVVVALNCYERLDRLQK